MSTDSIEEIIQRFNGQDDMLRQLKQSQDQLKQSQDQIHMLLKGSEGYQIEGVMPSLKRISREVKHIQEWMNDEKANKGKYDVATATKIFLLVSSALGALLTATHFLIKYYERVEKLIN